MRELSLLIGKSQAVVGYLERGQFSPRIETLLALSKTLHASVDYLLGANNKR